MQVLEDFSKIAGVRRNDPKTEALWIHPKCSEEKIFVPGKDMNWPKHKVKVLGPWLSTDPVIAITFNYNDKTEKNTKLIKLLGIP